MVKRNLSYNVIQVVDILSTNYKKYKSYNDLGKLDNKDNKEHGKPYVFPTIGRTHNQRDKSCIDVRVLSGDNLLSQDNNKPVSYSVFLQQNPGASKKQRVEAIQRFYDIILRR